MKQKFVDNIISHIEDKMQRKSRSKRFTSIKDLNDILTEGYRAKNLYLESQIK